MNESGDRNRRKTFLSLKLKREFILYYDSKGYL
jgi:hypothetical protein